MAIDWLGALATATSGLPGGGVVVAPFLRLRDQEQDAQHREKDAQYREKVNAKLDELIAGNESFSAESLHKLFGIEQQLSGISDELRRSLEAAIDFFNRAAFTGTVPAAVPVWHVPHRLVPHFTGRKKELNALHRQLTSKKQAALTPHQAIHGLGGSGKTQIALKYMSDHANDYDVIWWFHAEDPTVLASEYQLLAKRLGVPTTADPDQSAVDVVHRHLQDRSDWLLIFDNATEPQQLKRFLPPSGRGHVIITSRNPNWGGVADDLEIGVLPRSESIRFLCNRTGDKDRSEAGRLANQLGDLPLALEQAAAYMVENGISYDGFLKRLQQHQSEMLECWSASS